MTFFSYKELQKVSDKANVYGMGKCGFRLFLFFTKVNFLFLHLVFSLVGIVTK